ncbi:MAG: helix-turn-helix domain-containing protein [Nitrososphaeraceae archaeon]|nr:helix-turn-helix domain-containing protein [Nitrososphaeraceae archaeon]
MAFSRHVLTNLYKGESSPNVRERLLLILMVKHDDILPAHAADQLHRSRPWALYWLDRFSKEGINGLKDK